MWCIGLHWLLWSKSATRSITKTHIWSKLKPFYAWLNVDGTTVTGTVLLATEFWHFLCVFYNVTSPPQNSRSTLTAVAHPSIYLTHLGDPKEALSWHITTNYMTNSFTSLQYSKAVPDQRVIFLRELTIRRRGVTSLFWAYGKDILTPSSTANLATLTHIPVDGSQLLHSWIGRKRTIRTCMVGNSMMNENIFVPLFFLSMAC